MKEKTKNHLLNLLVFGEIFILVILMVFCIIEQGHCSTTTYKPNATGAVIEYSNPNTYLYGSVLDGTVMKNEKGRLFTSIRFKPYATPLLYDESVLFCGDVSGAFVPGPLVVTYSRQAHQANEGIGCHDLMNVTEVK